MNDEAINQAADAIAECLEQNDADGALLLLEKLRIADLKTIGYRIFQCLGRGMTKKAYMERLRVVVPRNTREAIARQWYAVQLCDLADKFATAKHHRELSAGALMGGGYNASLYDARGVAQDDIEILALAAKFAEVSREAGVPDEIKAICAQIMAAA